MHYFSKIYTPNSDSRAMSLYKEYMLQRQNYFGFQLAAEDIIFDTELVSKVIYDLKGGKAPDLAGLTAEHLQRAHPILPVILSKFFQLIVMVRHVPVWFGHNYIVPLPKSKDYVSKPLSCEDFSGIAISTVISKVFEYCLPHKFGDYLCTDSKQFGLKK